MPAPPLRHTAIRMGGGDPDEEHRVSTPLELFFDLTFAVIWAWIIFSWFASAYDTDDWIFRLVTMVRMLGVLLLAMGIQPLFASLVKGNRVDNGVMVMG